MKLFSRLLITLIAISVAACQGKADRGPLGKNAEAGLSQAAEEIEAGGDFPKELASFVGPDDEVLSYDSADLNGDGYADYIVVTQNKKLDEAETKYRILQIIVRNKDGSLFLKKTNNKAVLCSSCGGVAGDPFEQISVEQNSFTVSHYGGSNWRWKKDATFKFSKRDNTWQLTSAKEASFHLDFSDENGDPLQSQEEETYVPPKDFGKIDIADYDPYNFLGIGKK